MRVYVTVGTTSFDALISLVGTESFAQVSLIFLLYNCGEDGRRWGNGNHDSAEGEERNTPHYGA